MLGDTGLDDVLVDEVTIGEADLEVALARTRARHSELVTRRKRRTTMLAGLGALLIVGSAGVYALQGDEGSGVVTDLPLAADSAETSAVPTTTATPPVPPAEVGTAMVVRRVGEVESFRVGEEAGRAVVHLTFACELAGETADVATQVWEGARLHVSVDVESSQPGTRCDGTPLTAVVPVPDGVDPARVDVTIDRP